AEVGGPVEWHPHRPPMTGDRRLYRLADPPDRVRDELDAAVRIELPGRRHQAKIPLTDEIDEWNSPVLEFFGDRDHESNIVAGQALLGGKVAAEGLSCQLHLLVTGEEGNFADFVQIKIEAFPAFIDRFRDLGRPNSAPLPAWLHRQGRPSLGKGCGV